MAADAVARAPICRTRTRPTGFRSRAPGATASRRSRRPARDPARRGGLRSRQAAAPAGPDDAAPPAAPEESRPPMRSDPPPDRPRLRRARRGLHRDGERQTGPARPNVIDEAGLGDLMLTAGDPEEAVTYFRNSLAEEPDRPDLRRGLAISLTRAGKLTEAARVYGSSRRSTRRRRGTVSPMPRSSPCGSTAGPTPGASRAVPAPELPRGQAPSALGDDRRSRRGLGRCRRRL